MSRQLIRGVVVLVLYAGLGFHPVRASTVVVPDAFSTVQSAIDSGADTVLIREGRYPERPVVDHAVVLQGIGVGQRPRLDGLQVYSTNFWAFLPLLSVNRIDFSGRVEHTPVTVHPRNLQFSFSECTLDSGFYQVFSMDPNDVASLTIRNCHLGGRSSARVFTVVMEADTVDGGVAWNVREPWIQHCWFRGGPGMVAIQLTDDPRGLTANNRIENYGLGIYVQDGDGYGIEANTIIGGSVPISVEKGRGASSDGIAPEIGFVGSPYSDDLEDA